MGKEPYKMPNKPFVPSNTKKQTSTEGPFGGGTPFHQATLKNEFVVHNPIVGHSQKGNVKKVE